MVTRHREQAGREGRVDHGHQRACVLDDIADQLVRGPVGDVDEVACGRHGDRAGRYAGREAGGNRGTAGNCGPMVVPGTGVSAPVVVLRENPRTAALGEVSWSITYTEVIEVVGDDADWGYCPASGLSPCPGSCRALIGKMLIPPGPGLVDE